MNTSLRSIPPTGEAPPVMESAGAPASPPPIRNSNPDYGHGSGRFPNGSRSDLWVLAGGAVVVALGLAVVGWFEPRGQIFFPRCWLHEHTGLLCPGCGSTRALHALLHGDVASAWKLNPLAVLSVPGVAWLAIRHVRGVLTGRWWPNPFSRGWVILALMALLMVFGVARNFG